MDAEKFGAFVAEIRKERHMTQSELAAKIQVTDKAVSRWERGMGFPDINTLEPLANALGVSIHELMRSEHVKGNACSDTEAVELMRAAAELERESRRQDQTAAALTVFTTVITAILFHMTGRGNIGASLLFGLLAATAEVGIYLYMENRHDPGSRKVYGVLSVIFCVIIAALLGWLVG